MTKESSHPHQSEQQTKKQWSRTPIRPSRPVIEKETEIAHTMETQEQPLLTTSPRRNLDNCNEDSAPATAPLPTNRFVKPSARPMKICCSCRCSKKEEAPECGGKKEEPPLSEEVAVQAENKENDEERNPVAPKEGQTWMQLACENRANYFEKKERLRREAVMAKASTIMRDACMEALEKGSNSMSLATMPDSEVCKIITDQGFDITEQSTGLWSAGITLSWKLPETKKGGEKNAESDEEVKEKSTEEDNNADGNEE